MAADEFDRASEIEQWSTEMAIRQQLTSAARTPKTEALGYCLNPACGDDFDEGSLRLYCNADCEKEHRRIKIYQGE